MSVMSHPHACGPSNIHHIDHHDRTLIHTVGYCTRHHHPLTCCFILGDIKIASGVTGEGAGAHSSTELTKDTAMVHSMWLLEVADHSVAHLLGHISV